mmetsp:Transcript_141847/g.453558  ORF Transcript_141847/g.453558 Transcript_141847/m.453558 type:complete len:201 (+) Transcript_141847:664-1266(+)
MHNELSLLGSGNDIRERSEPLLGRHCCIDNLHRTCITEYFACRPFQNVQVGRAGLHAEHLRVCFRWRRRRDFGHLSCRSCACSCVVFVANPSRHGFLQHITPRSCGAGFVAPKLQPTHSVGTGVATHIHEHLGGALWVCHEHLLHPIIVTVASSLFTNVLRGRKGQTPRGNCLWGRLQNHCLWQCDGLHRHLAKVHINWP